MDRGLALSLVVFIVLALLGVAVSGCRNQEPEYKPTEEEYHPLTSLGNRVILSSDQTRVIDQFGYPSHFFISIDPLSSDRVETWTYFPERVAYTFSNGRLLRKEDAEDQSDEYPPTNLKPEDFGPTLSISDAGAMLGKLLYSKNVQDQTGEGTILMIYEKAILTYMDGRLVGVETMIHPASPR
jgi:hypothetical protein